MIRVNRMPSISNHSTDAFTGLEAAIVLIAFVVVASVFAYVILGAGFFTTQKSQETIYKSVEQASTNVQIVGNVYGLQSTGSSGINEIRFSIELTAGSPAVDLEKMKIVFSTKTTEPVILSRGTTSDRSTFTTKDGGITDVTALKENQQVEIAFKVAPVQPYSTMNIEVRPVVGAVIPLSRTIPAILTGTNILL
jgi:archaeal flagellin FlaB